MSDLRWLTAAAAAQAIAARKLSPVELMTALLERIGRLDPPRQRSGSPALVRTTFEFSGPGAPPAPYVPRPKSTSQDENDFILT